MDSFLARHRTICAVLTELREHPGVNESQESCDLIDEAIDYAQRMSARLMEYKRKEEKQAKVDAWQLKEQARD